MTDAELHELILMSADQIDSAFEFWLTISFGVLIAMHVTKGAISSYIKLLMCGLYIAATSVAVLLTIGDVMQINGYAAESDVSLGGIGFSATSDFIRFGMYFIGGASVAVLIFRYETWIENRTR